ncbi:MAG: hypothetical protein GTO22_24170 [Gemmatimonadales bacterium]|nr:hypothetical protein [Gemmatimonadales bacterium]
MRLPLVLAATAACSSTVHAQLVGVPPIVVPKSLIGSDVTVTLGSGYQEHTVGGVIPVAGRVAWNGDRLSVIGAGAWLPAPRDGVSNGFGAGLAFGWQATPFDPATNPFIWKPLARIHVGAAYSQFEEEGLGTWRQLDVPLAVGLGWVLPAQTLNVLGWLAAEGRIRMIRDPSGGGETENRAGGGLSAGVDVYKANCPPENPDCVYGWGVRLGGEALLIENVRTGGTFEWSAFLGVIWKFF